jgi:hypothetical protein
MLRITPVHDALRLEGKLLGPWVAELARACAEQPAPDGRLSLDLAAVTFVDGPGVELLRDLLRRGIRLGPCSGLVAELLHGEGQ